MLGGGHYSQFLASFFSLQFIKQLFGSLEIKSISFLRAWPHAGEVRWSFATAFNGRKISSFACPHSFEYSGCFITRGGCHTASFRKSDIKAFVPRIVEAAKIEIQCFFFESLTWVKVKMGLQSNQIYGFHFIFMFKAFLSALFRFFSCTHNFMIPTAQTASSKDIKSQVCSVPSPQHK